MILNPFIYQSGGGGALKIQVNVETGSTVTASKGGSTYTGTEISTGVYEIEVPEYGTYTVTATKGGATAINTITLAAQSVTEVFADPVLENNTWAKISEVSAADQGANVWSVGDCKAVALNGTCGTLALNTTLYAYIIGFDHNEALEGKGITFGTWKTAATNGIDVALIDSDYATNKSNGTKAFNINHWGDNVSPMYNSNYGGWKGCDCRYDVLGSTNIPPSGYGSMATTSRVGYDADSSTPTTPVNDTLMACLPSALREVMKPIAKFTDNVGNNVGTESCVSKSIDYLPLLAEWEIFGARTYANEYEQNYQSQYDYYKNGNSAVKYKHNETSAASNWWERSPNPNNVGAFCYVLNAGTAYYRGTRQSNGVAPIFKV